MEKSMNVWIFITSLFFGLCIQSHGFKLRRIYQQQEVKRDDIPNPQWTREANGKLYSITANKNGFYENSDICDSAGGNLATASNVLDQESLNSFIKKSRPQNEQFLWIGLNVEGSRTWIWHKTKLFVANFMNWSPGQPTSNNALQDCGAAGPDGTWYSIPCDNKHQGICERSDGATGANIVAPTRQPTAQITDATTTTSKPETTASSSKGGSASESQENKQTNEMKGGKFEKHPTLEKTKEKEKVKIDEGERCNLINFINKYRHPVVISRNAHSGEKKEFVIEGKNYKLNTVFKKVQSVIRMEPVVYSARDEKKSLQLLLAGKETFTLMPGDCDGDFVDVEITPSVKGIILNDKLKDKDESDKKKEKLNDVKSAKDVPAKKSSCAVETFGGNSGDSCCHFPFKFNDRMYHDCTSVEKRHLWCGTTRDFDRDAMWGFCCLDGECTS